MVDRVPRGEGRQGRVKGSLVPRQSPNRLPLLGPVCTVGSSADRRRRTFLFVSQFIEYMAKVPNTFDEYDDDGESSAILSSRATSKPRGLADSHRRPRSLISTFRRVAIRPGRLHRARQEAENKGRRHGPLLRPATHLDDEEGGWCAFDHDAFYVSPAPIFLSF